MKLNRTKNAVRNTVFGGLNFVYSTITPFVMRTLMLYFLGVEYTGLNGLFASILQVLNLLVLVVESRLEAIVLRRELLHDRVALGDVRVQLVVLVYLVDQ